MKEIFLTQGKYAIVDDEDFDWLSQHKWFFARYAFRHLNKTPTRKLIGMHHAILQHYGFNLTGKQTDHINCNKLDNRKANLRTATLTENNHNREIQVNNTSGYKGVVLSSIKDRDKIYHYWRAFIKNNGKRLCLGNFKTPQEAALAYNSAAKKYFGEFAKLNQIV